MHPLVDVERRASSAHLLCGVGGVCGVTESFFEGRVWVADSACGSAVFSGGGCVSGELGEGSVRGGSAGWSYQCGRVVMGWVRGVMGGVVFSGRRD